MALDIIDAFEDESCTTRYSEQDDAEPLAYPIRFTLDGTNGDVIEQPVFLKNLSLDMTLTNGVVQIGNPSSSITYALALDNNGVPGTYSDTLNLPDISPGNIVKIWIKQEIAAGTDAAKITGHTLNIIGLIVPA